MRHRQDLTLEQLIAFYPTFDDEAFAHLRPGFVGYTRSREVDDVVDVFQGFDINRAFVNIPGISRIKRIWVRIPTELPDLKTLLTQQLARLGAN